MREEKEPQNAYEEAVDKWCYAIEEHDDQTACRYYLDAITFILLKVNEEKLKQLK